MDAELRVEVLQGQTGTIPGGKDKEGRPIVLLTVPTESPPPDILATLKYLLSIFSNETRARGISVLLDARKGPWKTTRSYIRQINTTLTPAKQDRLLVMKPDGFWDKQRVENCTSTQNDVQVIFTQQSRISKFVDQSQLPVPLGGTYIYNHEQWIDNRLKAEEFFKTSAMTLKHLEEFHQHLLNNQQLRANAIDDALNNNSNVDAAESIKTMSRRCLEAGQELLTKIEYDNRNRKFASETESMTTPQDILDTIQKTDGILNKIRYTQNQIDESIKQAEKFFQDTKDLSLLTQGIVHVINWILGPAEKLLNSQVKVGCDVTSAEELRNSHETIELQCWEAYGMYAELLHKINSFSTCEISENQRNDLLWQKDFMDFVCRSFATRLERRRNLLITSLRFFRLVSEYFDRTGEVFESLVMGSNVADFSNAKVKLLELQENQQYLDVMEREIEKEGEKLSDILSIPIKNAFGRELLIDYSEDIINIRDILDATKARKNLFCDSVELQKLTLEQVTHIDTYEKDAIQAVRWLDELFQVLLQDHGHVGITVYEIQSQKYEHQAYQETAKDTYNYGCQLLNASLALRQSCKLPIQDHTFIHQQLNHFWHRFMHVSQEQITRLRVSAIFHRSVEEHCNQLRDLREAVATMPLEDMFKKQTRVRNFISSRELLMLEVGRMVRLGKLLRSRLRTPVYLNDELSESTNSTDSEKACSVDDLSVEDNTIAIEAISEKLLEVTELAEELDQALRSAQRDCEIFTANSSPTSSTSTTPTTVISMSTNQLNDLNTCTSENVRRFKSDDLKSDDEFLTASDCTLPHSRSSSYNTASECEQMYAPWWEQNGRNDFQLGTSKEKMVLGVGLPELPPPADVLKPSTEVPPGKIMREVTETIHLKVKHSHTLGVASYVLTSEIAGESNLNGTVIEECASARNLEATTSGGKEFNESGFSRRLQECGDWLQLKILELHPELTTLGDTLTEAGELQRAHDEVLRQLQNKQSPVEELLRQADQLISTQKPRAEVYAAMAESLGRAWKDVNVHLNIRKQILDLNVQYHTKAELFFQKMNELEATCTDAVVPIDTQSIKDFLTTIHEIRRLLLESLMGALQTGNLILGKLRDLGAESTLDSRPDRIRSSVNRAITQVQGWLDKLHTRRQNLEVTFTGRKNQLEQCLALAMLASDLKDVEDGIISGRELLRNTDQLGDSSSSAELLLHEHNKILPEAKQLQERALKITKATENLVASGCFAGEKATEQAYTILSMSSEYLSDIDQRSLLLEKVITFFRLAQSAITKLDQFEIQIKTSELSSTSPQLAQLHSQCARAIEEITNSPLTEGYAILETGGTGTGGVKRTVEDLENRKIYLDGLCSAHREEKLRVNQALNNFLESHNILYSWLVTSAEAFLQGHQDMGSDLLMAKNFWELHNQLLVDLQTKGNEINSLLLSLPPILEYLEDNQRIDVDGKVEELHQLWLKLKSMIEIRLDLSAIYVKFHTEADIVNQEIDKLTDALSKTPHAHDDATIAYLEQKWESLIPLYQSAKNTGLTFINEVNKVSEPYLDTKRACVCVESVLERLSGRQLVVTRNWQSFQTNVVERREIQVQLEVNMVESNKTINWVSKLDSQLYPVITSNSTNPKDITAHLEDKLQTVYPDIKKAQNEVEQRIKNTETLIAKGTCAADEQSLNIKNKLIDLNQKLVEITTDYQVLLQMLIGYFINIAELDKTTDNLNKQYEQSPMPQSASETETAIREFEASKHAILEMVKFAQNESEKLVFRINKQEPNEAALQDIQKLRHILEIHKNKWENDWRLRKETLESHKQISQFNFDLIHINEALDDVSRQLTNIKGQYGQSTTSAKATSQAFNTFEKTVQMLGQRIETFVNGSDKLLQENSAFAPLVEKQIQLLQQRWDTIVKQVQDTRRLLNLSIAFFQLVDEADEWFKQGSQILVAIARKATTVKQPQEAEELLKEIEDFLKPGEAKQNDRIAKITELANQLYDTQLATKTADVVVANRDMLDSFESIIYELQTLTSNLKASHQERERFKKEQEELDAQLAAARLEREAAEASLKAAEEAKKTAEAASQELHERLSKTVEIIETIEVKKEIPAAAAEKQISDEPEVVLEAPVFVVPLSDATIQEGSKFIFVCKVIGVPTPVVIWYKDGISIENNTDYQTTFDNRTCTLQIDETFVVDSARYCCKATNAAGTAKTQAVLSVNESEPKEILTPPNFIKPLQPAFVKEGQAFQFECLVGGNPLPTVQWFKNGECIDYLPDYMITYNNGAAILKIDKVFLEHKAEYTCKACNQIGTAQTTANVNVAPAKPNESPNFITPLSNVMGRAGQKIKLECEVSGVPEPSLTWTHNGKTVIETSELKFQKDGIKVSLTISEAYPKDAGTYLLTASNIAGEASSETSVTVKGRLPNETSDSEITSDMEPIKPSIYAALKDVSIFEGKKVVLDCVIIGQPEPEVIWYHNGQPVKESSDFQLLFQGDRCSLIIQEALIEDAGEYKVVALNSAGEASSSCTLIVTPLSDAEATVKPVSEQEEKPAGSPPKFSKLLSDVLVSEGDKVIFEGTVTGEPRPEIKWLLNNHNVISNEHVKIGYGLEGNVKLEIEKVVPEDKGVYTVKATNSLGDAKCFAQLIVKSSKPIEVQKEYEEIKIAPIFRELFADRTAFEGTPTKFECIVTGKPTPRIKWLYNNEPVSGNNFLISTSGERQVLSISQLDKSHAGRITCTAENEAGKASCTATLTVQPVSDLTLPECQIIQNGDISSSSYTSKREVFMQSSTSSTSKIISNQSNTGEPQIAERGYIAQDSHSIVQVNQEPPHIRESHLKEEYHKVDHQPPTIHEKTISTVVIGEPIQTQETISTQQITVQKVIKSRPPKFTNPIVGKIVDQGVDVVLDGIIDGSPTPTIVWSKNGTEITSGSNIELFYENHRVQIKIKNVKTSDSGRYTCTATNDAGTAVSTSDLVVKKTTFPPVFGRRLQAQVVKKGERVRMDVEVTGTPVPTITWFKDDKPLEEVLQTGYKVLVQGNSYTLVIEKADFNHTGKYMVRAVNSGGEAQSIADFAVFEPTPDTMVEVVKTVVFEDVQKHETLAHVADQSKTTFSTSKQYQPISKSTPIVSQLQPSVSPQVTSKSEFSSLTETKISEESKIIKMESSCSDFGVFPKSLITTDTNLSSLAPEQGIETSSISKRSSLDFFVQKLKDNEEQSTAKENLKSTPLKREIYTKFEDTIEHSKTYRPATTKFQEEYSSSEYYHNQEQVPLQRGPLPEICYAPRYDMNSKFTTTEKAASYSISSPNPIAPPKSTKAEVTHASQSYLNATTQNVRPTSPRPSAEALEMEKLWVPHREHDVLKPVSRPVSGLSEPSTDALTMEKTWAHKFSETTSDSPSSTWPPPPPKVLEPQSWSAQTTLEKKWVPTQQKLESPHYVARITDVHETGYTKSESSFSETRKEHIIEESHRKPSEIIKSWPPPPKPEEPISSHHILPERPISVQDITDEIYLQPGPPVEIGFAPAPPEMYEAPPLPPKQERPHAPPLPARPIKHVDAPHVEPVRTYMQTASTFKRGKITDSDYESDLDATRIPAKWKPPTSDSEEPSYRKVQAPTSRNTFKPKSVEPREAIPPFTHEQPPTFVGHSTSIEYDNKEIFKKQQVKKQGKQYTRTEQVQREVTPPPLKPGSPPQYLQAPPPKIADGYMADTDEPFMFKKVASSENLQQRVVTEEFNSISKPAPPKVYRKHVTSTAAKKELVSTPLISSTTIQHKIQMPPSPTKFRESDYESEYEGRKPAWTSPQPSSKPVRPSFVAHTAKTSLNNIDHSSSFTGVQPKFKPIEKPQAPVKLNTLLTEETVYKPKPVTSKPPDVIIATPAAPEKSFLIQPGSPPEIAYAPGPKTTQYYRSTTSAPYQNAVQTETSNVMHMNESTETSHRTVSLQQTRKVITFGQQKEEYRRSSVPPPATPTKFIKGDFRESDYDSEVENIRIKAKWAPGESDTDEPRYRKVKAPQSIRSLHSQSSKQRILSPLEFDKGPVTFTKSSDVTDSTSQVMRYNTSQQAQTATKLASKHMDDMTQSFKSKTQKFSNDIMSDVKRRNIDTTPESNAQVYREESRAAHHGTKHIDPDTGLIYFKYDFGYEFGVVLPGQSKGGEIPVPKKTIIEPPKRTRDIEMPVYHETTQSNHSSARQTPKTVKWESESEMSEYEGDHKKNKQFYKSRWEQSSTSPASLSPSLPSTSPAFNSSVYRNVETPLSGPETPVNLTVVTHAKRPPLFITPLRDIAVVSGQCARFECIVQSETTPTILWSKNGRMVENCNNYHIHYRNGVCRLTIPQAYPEDAGTYTCSAANQIGSVITSATLQVPGERRSQYIK